MNLMLLLWLWLVVMVGWHVVFVHPLSSSTDGETKKLICNADLWTRFVAASRPRPRRPMRSRTNLYRIAGVGYFFRGGRSTAFAMAFCYGAHRVEYSQHTITVVELPTKRKKTEL